MPRFGYTTLGFGAGAAEFENVLSLDFDGTDDFLLLGSAVTFSGDFTLSMWVKPDRNNNNILGNSAAIGNYLYTNSSAVLIMAGGFAAQTFTNCTISTGAWTHIAITRDDSDELKCYKNGSLTDTKTSVSAAFAFNQVSNYNDLDNAFQGNVDELAAITSALSASDVSDVYNGGDPTNLRTFSPVGWWRMGDGDTFPTITDHGSGGNDGTMTNMLSGDIVADVP